MNQKFSNSAQKFISLVILGFFIFSFAHSELGFINYDEGEHSTHDYCKLVNSISTHQKLLRDELTKLEASKAFFAQHFENIDQHAENFLFIKNNRLNPKHLNKAVYLVNKAILI